MFFIVFIKNTNYIERIRKMNEIPDFLVEFFNSHKFCLGYLVSNRGKGKTLFLALFSKYYSKYYPKNPIHSNFLLKLPNFYYNPYCFYPYSKLQNSLILIDDCINVKSLSKIIELASNNSRKMNLILFLTAQYKKYVAKSLREISEYYIEVEYSKEKDKLLVHLIDSNFDSTYWLFDNAVKTVKDIYDTNEIVKLPLDKYIITEIFKVSESKDDIQLNLFSYYSRSTAIVLYKGFIKYTFKQLKKFTPNDIDELFIFKRR